MQASTVREVMHTLLGRGLTTPQVEQLAQASVSRKAAAGQALMNEGERPGGLMLLLQGNVEIFKQGGDGQRQSLAKVAAPTLLGEMSLITDRPTSATVVAVTECDYQLLTRSQFQRLIASDSLAAYKLVVGIAGILAERLGPPARQGLGARA